MTFSFGQSEHERLAVDVISYERPVTGEHYDDNWLVVTISISAGGFSGRARATILTDELVSFAEQLHPLCESLKGTAEFTTLEGQLLLKLAGDGRGHIHLSGVVTDRPGLGNTLSFTFEFDQTLLQRSINELDSVIRAFPVRIEEA
jgi:hypothetical protein